MKISYYTNNINYIPSIVLDLLIRGPQKMKQITYSNRFSRKMVDFPLGK